MADEEIVEGAPEEGTEETPEVLEDGENAVEETPAEEEIEEA